MKINFGCGKNVLDGYVNVDAIVNPKARRAPEVLHALEFDEIGALVKPTPIDDESADELLAAHVIEHFYRWQTAAVLTEWKRMLRPGGLLILELPNLDLCARNLLDGTRDQMSYWGFYGDPGHRDPYMCHRWGFTPGTIQAALDDAGFVDIRHRPPQTHRARVRRDMRVEARKL